MVIVMVMVSVMVNNTTSWSVTCKHSESLPSEVFSEGQTKPSVAPSYQDRLVLKWETSLTIKIQPSITSTSSCNEDLRTARAMAVGTVRETQNTKL